MKNVFVGTAAILSLGFAPALLAQETTAADALKKADDAATKAVDAIPAAK
ncbi:MAG: hypothetical protein V1495_10925 [Pseudomonadota bacterium]